MNSALLIPCVAILGLLIHNKEMLMLESIPSSVWISCSCALLLYLYMIPDALLVMIEQIEPRIKWRFPTGKQPKKKPMVALSIDDVPFLGHKSGPHKQGESHFAEILDILKEYHVRATIMVMSHEDGQSWYPGLLQRAVREGHELGNHGTIDEMAANLPQDEFETKFESCHAYISLLQPGFDKRRYKWFRPGGGRWTSLMLSHIEERGYTAVLASVYPVLELVLPRLGLVSFGAWITGLYLRFRVRPGAVLLVHDRWHTAASLKVALPSIVQKYNVGTITELCEDKD